MAWYIECVMPCQLGRHRLGSSVKRKRLCITQLLQGMPKQEAADLSRMLLAYDRASLHPCCWLHVCKGSSCLCPQLQSPAAKVHADVEQIS